MNLVLFLQLLLVSLVSLYVFHVARSYGGFCFRPIVFFLVGLALNWVLWRICQSILVIISYSACSLLFAFLSCIHICLMLKRDPYPYIGLPPRHIAEGTITNSNSSISFSIRFCYGLLGLLYGLGFVLWLGLLVVFFLFNEDKEHICHGGPVLAYVFCALCNATKTMGSRNVLHMDLWCLVIQYAFPTFNKAKDDIYGINTDKVKMDRINRDKVEIGKVEITLSSVKWIFSVTELVSLLAQPDQVLRLEKWLPVILKDDMFQEWKSTILAQELRISTKKWQLLIQSKANVCARGNYPILFASERGQLQVMRCLIANKADINAKNGAPLCWASADGNFKVVHWLVENKADVNCGNGGPLSWACNEGRLDVVRYLLENKADVNILNDAPLIRLVTEKIGN